jgi:hypothetical protein
MNRGAPRPLPLCKHPRAIRIKVDQSGRRHSRLCDSSDRNPDAEFNDAIRWNAKELGGRDSVARHHEEQPQAP